MLLCLFWVVACTRLKPKAHGSRVLASNAVDEGKKKFAKAFWFKKLCETLLLVLVPFRSNFSLTKIEKVQAKAFLGKSVFWRLPHQAKYFRNDVSETENVFYCAKIRWIPVFNLRMWWPGIALNFAILQLEHRVKHSQLTADWPNASIAVPCYILITSMQPLTVTMSSIGLVVQRFLEKKEVENVLFTNEFELQQFMIKASGAMECTLVADCTIIFTGQRLVTIRSNSRRVPLTWSSSTLFT